MSTDKSLEAMRLVKAAGDSEREMRGEKSNAGNSDSDARVKGEDRKTDCYTEKGKPIRQGSG